MIDDSSTEWVTEVEFTLNCTESKRAALSATSRAPRAKWHWTFGITVTSWFQEVLGVKSDSCKRSWPLLSQSIRHREFFDCWYMCAFVCVFTCVLTHFCVCFPLRAISEGQIVSSFEPNLSQRGWHKMCLFCFCKTKFCCKMHMQKFCTEVTILPW